ncbi:uncharacterized protein LOC129766203 [Toxorhynchites rutilus septentrionalis]|uniref:uncharacterized protein LOC129766203 n=1 Tax=Toxorhynchites rutilus septentrionalis TaxID=329112 RepID=UPI00247935E6|nr:uncharacterized protein LOC129766203 [Toxorhynchites rutilus septentrionalis]
MVRLVQSFAELIDTTSKKIPFIAGIISAGTGCSDGSVGIYTRVASYIDWIESTTGANSSHAECARNTECTKFYKETPSNIQYRVCTPKFLAKLLNENDGDTPFCGGALIDYRHVITSADCVSGSNKPTHVIISFDKIGVSEVIIHPEYQPNVTKHNLALLVLEKYFDNKEIFITACLWKAPTTPSEDILISATEQSSFGDKRLIINTTTVQHSQCKANIICTENRQNVIPEVCKYNSGDPVTSVFDEYIPIIYGVNSKGNGCGGKDNIFEISSIPFNYDWIESIIIKGSQLINSQKKQNFRGYFLNSTCSPPTGGIGRCIPDQMCPKLINDHRRNLSKIKICFFEGHRAVFRLERKIGFLKTTEKLFEILVSKLGSVASRNLKEDTVARPTVRAGPGNNQSESRQRTVKGQPCDVDDLGYLMLMHLTIAAKCLLLQVFNDIWIRDTILNVCKTVTSSVSGYRSITLLSCVEKVMEKMVNRRLTEVLEREKLLDER